jgi:hypothetical protein
MNFDNLTIQIPVFTGDSSEIALTEPQPGDTNATKLLMAGFEGSEIATLLNRQFPAPLELAPEVREHLIQVISREIQVLEQMLAPHEAASKARTAASQALLLEAMRQLDKQT